MRPYTIRSVTVEVQYAGGQTKSWKLNVQPDTRTVLVGLDALGAAGTFDPLPESPLMEVQEPVQASAASGGGTAGGLRKPQPVEEGGMEVRSLSLTRDVEPDYCEYRNGKWYCWTNNL